MSYYIIIIFIKRYGFMIKNKYQMKEIYFKAHLDRKKSFILLF